HQSARALVVHEALSTVGHRDDRVVAGTRTAGALRVAQDELVSCIFDSPVGLPRALGHHHDNPHVSSSESCVSRGIAWIIGALSITRLIHLSRKPLRELASLSLPRSEGDPGKRPGGRNHDPQSCDPTYLRPRR